MKKQLKIKRYAGIGYSRGSIILEKLLTDDKHIKKAILVRMSIDFTNLPWERKLLVAEASDGKAIKKTQGTVAQKNPLTRKYLSYIYNRNTNL